MPQVAIPAIVAGASKAAAYVIAGKAIAWGVVLTSAAVAAGGAAAQYAFSRGGGSVQVPETLVSAPITMGGIPYGLCRVGGQLMDARYSGSDFWIVVAFACIEIDGYVNLYSGDDVIWSEAEGVAPEYAGKLEVYTRFGSDDQLGVQEYIDASNGELDASWRGSGIAYCVFRLKGFAKNWGASIPPIWSELRGAKVFDPRTGAVEFSANWALCVAHYLELQKAGGNVLRTKIDQPALISAANACDELRSDIATAGEEGEARRGVFLGALLGYQEAQHRQYELNGVVSSGLDPDEALQKMMPYGMGDLMWIDGRYHIRAGGYHTPVRSLSKADFLQLPTLSGAVTHDRQIDAITGYFSDPVANYRETDFASFTFENYDPADGERRFLDVGLEWENHPARARRLAVLAGRQTFRDDILQGALMPEQIDLMPGENVGVNIPELGVNAIFEVSDLVLNLSPAGAYVDARALINGPDFWTSAEEVMPPTGAPSSLPSPARAIQPANLQLDNATALTDDGAISFEIGVTFTSQEPNAREHIVTWTVRDPEAIEDPVYDLDAPWASEGVVTRTASVGLDTDFKIEGLREGDQVTVFVTTRTILDVLSASVDADIVMTRPAGMASLLARLNHGAGLNNLGFEAGVAGLKGAPVGWLLEASHENAATQMLEYVRDVSDQSPFASQLAFGYRADMPNKQQCNWWRIGRRFEVSEGQTLSASFWAKVAQSGPITGGGAFVGEDDAACHMDFVDAHGNVQQREMGSFVAFGEGEVFLDRWISGGLLNVVAPAGVSYVDVWFVAVDGGSADHAAHSDYEAWAQGQAALVLFDDIQITSDGPLIEVPRSLGDASYVNLLEDGTQDGSAGQVIKQQHIGDGSILTGALEERGVTELLDVMVFSPAVTSGGVWFGVQVVLTESSILDVSCELRTPNPAGLPAVIQMIWQRGPAEAVFSEIDTSITDSLVFNAMTEVLSPGVYNLLLAADFSVPLPTSCHFKIKMNKR